MPLPPIRPRDTRLGIDVVREQLQRNPMVLKVTNRTLSDITMTLYKVSNVDIDFANNYFYWNDTNAKTPTPTALLMVPFQFNGEV